MELALFLPLPAFTSPAAPTAACIRSACKSHSMELDGPAIDQAAAGDVLAAPAALAADAQAQLNSSAGAEPHNSQAGLPVESSRADSRHRQT